MTEILFYTFADNPLDVARRVAAKAYGQGMQVMIYAPDAATAACEFGLGCYRERRN